MLHEAELKVTNIKMHVAVKRVDRIKNEGEKKI